MQILILILLLFSSNSYSDRPLVLNKERANAEFSVSLGANPSTGFQWKLSYYDKRLFRLIDSHYSIKKKSAQDMIGAGGIMVFKFALKSGHDYPLHTKMSFIYARSWDPASGTLKSVRINFY